MTEHGWLTWTDVMVTAHRKLPKGIVDEWLKPELTKRLIRLRDEYGMERATTGLAIGGDSVFADVALELGFPLHGALPFPDQPGGRWTRAQVAHWEQLKQRCAQLDMVSPVNPSNYAESVRMLHKRNDWMLARNQAVVAIWAPANKTGGTYSCIVKAVGAGKPVILFDIAARTVSLPRPRDWALRTARPALAAASQPPLKL